MDEPSAPFDEFGPPEKRGPEIRRGFFSNWTCRGLQAISLGGLWLALLAAVFIVALHVFRVLAGKPADFWWAPKSAIPLILIGVAYISLICTVPRTAAQRVLGFLVGLAFVLWGVEQFLQDQRWISFIDDFVVLLFVFDLSLVIRENLARSAAERRARQAGK